MRPEGRKGWGFKVASDQGATFGTLRGLAIQAIKAEANLNSLPSSRHSFKH